MKEWWLVIIAGLTGFMIGWQSWETRKAAQAGAAQANTAARSARAFINKERSRLFLAHEITPEFEVTVMAVNRGQSPAHVTYKFVGSELLKPTESCRKYPGTRIGESLQKITCGMSGCLPENL